MLLRGYFYSFTDRTCTKTTNYSGTKLVGDLRKRIHRRVLTFSTKPCIWSFRVIFSRGQQRNVPKFKTHVQSDCFCSLNLLFCGVIVAVAVPCRLKRMQWRLYLTNRLHPTSFRPFIQKIFILYTLPLTS